MGLCFPQFGFSQSKVLRRDDIGPQLFENILRSAWFSQAMRWKRRRMWSGRPFRPTPRWNCGAKTSGVGITSHQRAPLSDGKSPRKLWEEPPVFCYGKSGKSLQDCGKTPLNPCKMMRKTSELMRKPCVVYLKALDPVVESSSYENSHVCRICRPRCHDVSIELTGTKATYSLAGGSCLLSRCDEHSHFLLTVTYICIYIYI